MSSRFCFVLLTHITLTVCLRFLEIRRGKYLFSIDQEFGPGRLIEGLDLTMSIFYLPLGLCRG